MFTDPDSERPEKDLATDDLIDMLRQMFQARRSGTKLQCPACMEGMVDITLDYSSCPHCHTGFRVKNTRETPNIFSIDLYPTNESREVTPWTEYITRRHREILERARKRFR